MVPSKSVAKALLAEADELQGRLCQAPKLDPQALGTGASTNSGFIIVATALLNTL
jgi:hypothetical protein